VEPGDVVAFSMASCIDYAVAYAACTRLGAVATGINTRFGPREVTAISSGASRSRCCTSAPTPICPPTRPPRRC